MYIAALLYEYTSSALLRDRLGVCLFICSVCWLVGVGYSIFFLFSNRVMERILALFVTERIFKNNRAGELACYQNYEVIGRMFTNNSAIKCTRHVYYKQDCGQEREIDASFYCTHFLTRILAGDLSYFVNKYCTCVSRIRIIAILPPPQI